MIHYFLGLEVNRSAKGLFLNQFSYALDLLKRTDMHGVKPCTTPVGLTKFDHSSSILSDPTFYKSTVGAFHYLPRTRPGFSFCS